MVDSLLGSRFLSDEALNGSKRPSRLFYRSRAAVCAGCFLFLFLLVLILPSAGRKSVVEAVYSRGKQDIRSVHNNTLGFQRVFAIGLPGRTDKRDALSLAAAYSRVDVEWENGILFNDIPAKAIPEAFDNMPSHITGGAKAAIIGSWRAHMNVLTRIVNEKIETALILEDDVDWDVNLKPQLEEFARGAIELQNDHPGGDSPRGSPYGHNWDLLWLGHCRAAPSSETQKLYFIHNDTTVPPKSLRTAQWYQRHPPREVNSNDTRIVFHAQTGGCTFGYAITWEAAQKLVVSLSLEGEGIIYDISVGHMCTGLMVSPFTCYGVFPPLISSHRFAGSASRDSDIKSQSGHRQHKERTYDIVYSTIQNLARLLSGAEDVLSQWPSHTIPRRRLDESYADQVQRETRVLNMVAAPEVDEGKDEMSDDNFIRPTDDWDEPIGQFDEQIDRLQDIAGNG